MGHDDLMRAIVQTETGSPDVLQLSELPDPEPGPGDLLVDVAHERDLAEVVFRDRSVAAQHECVGLDTNRAQCRH